MKTHSNPTRIALALALCFGSAHLAQAQTSLGEVQAQGQAAAATSGGFFLQAPAGTVGSVAQQQLDTIQQFNPDATQATPAAPVSAARPCPAENSCAG
ncbi:hypothetical protein GALL_343710 [mine drainage metagenome]|uniref:Uncharacterized protein n=1 Tax=mine drainage metagenome TaxID=410659 RepID=A0A1J5QKJ1_9ZZZZ